MPHQPRAQRQLPGRQSPGRSRLNRGSNPGPNRSPDSGFALALVVIVGLILLVGGFATLARSFAGLMGATRNEQARQAREVAETGLAKTLELLNRKYSYLLINCYSRSGSPPTPNDCINTGSWATPRLPSSICPGSSQNTALMPLEGPTSDPKGKYLVDYFAYSGTQFYGGTGKLKVTGLRMSSDGSRILATSSVEETFDVKPKPCDARFGDIPTSSGFPGLLGWNINLGNNDVKGITSGNVLCIQCQLQDPDRPPTQAEAEAAVGALPNSDVDGKIFIGPITAPAVPSFPSQLRGFVTAKAITGTTAIVASATATTSSDTTTNRGMCATDTSNPPITHCLVSSINLTGQEMLRINSAAGPVRLYVSGNISASGTSGIAHDGQPGNLGLFGNALSSDPSCISNPTYTNQTITLAGSSKPSKAANLFAYFPCGTVSINGGAQATASCDPSGECGGGDIQGAIWSKNWNGSASNQAQLVVPKDMASQVLSSFGTQFAISVRDYVGIGINGWRGFQGF